MAKGPRPSETIEKVVQSRERITLVPPNGVKDLAESLRKAAYRLGYRLKIVSDPEKGVYVVKK